MRSSPPTKPPIRSCSRSLDMLADLMNTLLLATREAIAANPATAKSDALARTDSCRAEADRHARFRPDQRHRARPEQPRQVPQAAIDAMFRR